MNTGSISSIKFTLRGEEEIKKHSRVEITSGDEYTNNVPTSGGVHDLRLGTTFKEIKCPVCLNARWKCLGHSGHIQVAYPLINPFGFKDYKKWLKVVCHKCGNGVATPSNPADKLASAASASRSKNLICPRCRETHPIIKQHPTEKLALEAIVYVGSDKSKVVKSRATIYPHVAKEIFSRVSAETVISYGRHPDNHPSTTVLTTVTAPSNIIRPDIRQTGDDNQNTQSVTKLIIVLINKNTGFPAVIPEPVPESLSKKIWEFNNMYFEMIRAGGKETTSISGRFKGKPGRFRHNFLGKQVRRVARSTIIGDPTLQIDEIRVPQKFAKTVQLEETLQDYNRGKLLVLLANGRARYPGASAVVKRSGGVFEVNASTDLTSLENGDVVLRDILDGDYVYFNRNPSFMPSSMTGMKIVVSRDPTDLTIGMNVAVCVLFGADFDGDAMNLYFAANPAGMLEIETVGWVGNNIIHFSSTKMMAGQAQDSVIGLAELTRARPTFDKFHACFLFANALKMPRLTSVFGDSKEISGRESISVIMSRSPVNLTRKPTWYEDSFIPAVKYNPDEIKTVIRNGKLISGVLDKSTIGANAPNSLYQIISNDYGNREAASAISDMQQMAIQYMKLRGFTVSVSDILLPESARAQISAVSAECLVRSEVVTNQLIRGEILPPMGVSVRDQYETMQINALSNYDGYIDILLRHISHDENHLFKLAAFGSKGSINNMANVVSALGQKILNGQRMPKKFGYERTLPCYRMFDLTPEASGYITNSYIHGLTPAEVVFAGMCSRWALVIKALATSIGGQMSRDSIKSMESLITNYFRHVMCGQRVVSFVCGGDNLDPRKVETLSMPTVSLSSADFEEKYRHAEFPEEFERLSADREKYRRVFLTLESTVINEPFKDSRQTAVNINRIIENVLGASGDSSKAIDLSLATSVQRVADFCANAAYVYYNEDWEAARKPTSEVSRSLMWITCMQVRAGLCARELERKGISSKQVELILERARLTYLRALVDPGVAVGVLAAMGFSEPLMQQMMEAHRQSASGGSSLSGTKRAKEVFNIRTTEDMVAPEMIIQFTPEIARNKVAVQKIANDLEVIRFSTITFGQPLIFAETYGVPRHPAFKHESEIFRDFASKHPLLAPPGNLLHYCIRYELDKTQLILKNIEVEDVVVRLKSVIPELFIVYTPKNAEQVILRAYVRANYFKGNPTRAQLEGLEETIRGTTLRGMLGITRAAPVKLVRHYVDASGAIAQDANCWGVKTVGTNVYAGLSIPGSIPEKIFSNSVFEIYEMFGIEAARTVIINECRVALSSCNYRHYDVYASVITQKGYPTSITKTGTKEREPENILLNMGYSNPSDYLETSVNYNITSKIHGVSSPLVVGTVPQVGTNYSRLEIDEKFVLENTVSANAEFEELLGQ